MPHQQAGRAAAGTRLAGFFARAGAGSAGLFRAAAVGVPVLAGLVSVLLGQDTNWDLQNYHWYNAFAFFHGKLWTDLAPAGMQTYFNPLIDLPYYALNRVMPSAAVGFLSGLVQGLAFWPLLAVGWALFAGRPAPQRRQMALLLGLAGLLTANFLSTLGNTMGDGLTAAFVLAALAVCVAAVPRLEAEAARRPWCGGLAGAGLLLAAGCLAGIATGLKLTNAVYAVALCAALLLLPLAAVARLRVAFLFGLGVLAGTGLSAGWWFWTLWQATGNPLFPQFSGLFPSELARDVGVVDTLWRPKSALEAALWPFITALNPRRVGQIALHQVLWPLATLAFGAFLLRLAAARAGLAAAMAPLGGRGRLVIGYIVIGYLVWLKLFSIGRYLAPIEMVLPFAIWLLGTRLLPARRAAGLTAAALALSAAVTLFGGVTGWSHSGWADPAFRADRPAIDDPARATVLLAGGEPPWGFLVAELPPQVAAVGLVTTFPESPAYRARARAIATGRGGPLYAVLPGARDRRADEAAALDRRFRALGLGSAGWSCGAARSAVAAFGLRVQVVPSADGCHLAPAAPAADLAAENAALQQNGAAMLAAYGFRLEPESCTPLTAFIGTRPFGFQWCRAAIE